MERWDVLDEGGQKTGKTVERGKPMGRDEYHLVVNVWIRNKKGEFLISKRSPNKKLPNMWETTCGAVIVGEDSLRAAMREVQEEIGIELSPVNGQHLFRLKKQHAECPYFVDVWLFQEEIDITNVRYQPEEVCGAKWANPTTIQSMIAAGDFADTFSYLEGLFKLAK